MRYTSRGLRRRRNTNKWEVSLSHKDPLTGKTSTSYYTVEANTEKQARKKRDELILELERHGSVISSKVTVDELVSDLIAHKEESGSIEPSTAYHYRKDARVISRYIGDIRINDLGIPEVNAWVANMVDDGLAPRTITKPFRLLSQALKFAKAQDLITKNPCEFCKPPKIQRKAVTALSREDRTRMLGLVQKSLSTPVHLAVALALTTGMRREEICGLRWSDITSEGSITVARAIGIRKGGCYVKSPKTKESYRTIPLVPWLASFLAMRYEASVQELNIVGSPLGDPYILGTQEPDSRVYQPNRLSHEFRTFCNTHGFECEFHDLRHTFASMLIAQGVDVRTVASLLGHSNVAETLNIYAEADPDAKRSALDKIQGSFDVDYFPCANPKPDNEPVLSFTVSQLEAMLAEARRQNKY